MKKTVKIAYLGLGGRGRSMLKNIFCKMPMWRSWHCVIRMRLHWKWAASFWRRQAVRPA